MRGSLCILICFCFDRELTGKQLTLIAEIFQYRTLKKLVFHLIVIVKSLGVNYFCIFYLNLIFKPLTRNPTYNFSATQLGKYNKPIHLASHMLMSKVMPQFSPPPASKLVRLFKILTCIFRINHPL
tara:strand:- start:109 stop:486 length:378 start_codon:yes stop_codon:yes gene_type:complete